MQENNITSNFFFIFILVAFASFRSTY